MNTKKIFITLSCCWMGTNLAAQSLLVEQLHGPVTRNEIASFKAFIEHAQPSLDNVGNDWVYGSSGSTMEALGMMYETTNDTSILNKMIRFSDVALHIRNHADTGRVLWTGKRELCWPNKAVTAEDAGYSGSENGDVIAHIAYCAQLIIRNKKLWHYPVSIGDTYQFGRTYLARAKTYITELNRTIDHYIFPNFIQKGSYRFYWPQNEKWQALGARYKKDGGKPIPWNQQAMLAGGFQRLAECHELLNEQAKRVALYDSIVKAYSDWFISQLTPYDAGGHTCYKWSYAVNDTALKYMEDQGHGGYDVWGICRAYNRKIYGIRNEVMQQLANTVQYVMYQGNGSFSKRVDGKNGTQNYLGASYLFLARFRPQLYDIIALADLEQAKTKANYFAQIIFIKHQLALPL